MSEISEKLEEMVVYKCLKCSGKGRKITDWNAYNQLGIPVGFSKKTAKRQTRNYKKAFGHCSKCAGKGFLLKSKS